MELICLFTITGSLVSKGNTKYNGSTLKKSLKMDSKSSIQFTTTKDNATVKIVVKAKKAGASLSINDSSEGLEDIGTSVEVREVKLAKAGTYTLTKQDLESYVYYVEVFE